MRPPRGRGTMETGAHMAIKKSDLYTSLWASCDELNELPSAAEVWEEGRSPLAGTAAVAA